MAARSVKIGSGGAAWTAATMSRERTAGANGVRGDIGVSEPPLPLLGIPMLVDASENHNLPVVDLIDQAVGEMVEQGASGIPITRAN
jgi:hypothetical protein